MQPVQVVCFPSSISEQVAHIGFSMPDHSVLSFIIVYKMENNPRKAINNVCAGRPVLKKGSGRIGAETVPILLAVNESKNL